MENIKNIIEFYRILMSTSKFKVQFKKKDGTMRLLNGTLDFERIPKSEHPKEKNIEKVLKTIKDSGIIRVFDEDKNEWRSINFKTSNILETETGKKYRIIK